MMRRLLPLLALALAQALAARAATATALGHGDPAAGADAEPRRLADAPELERQILNELLGAEHWSARFLAAIRLERFDCDPTENHLAGLANRDTEWQVRAAAIRSLALRAVPQEEDWFNDESEPRVMRAVLRYGYELDSDRLERAVRLLTRSDRLDERLLGAEIAGASERAPLHETAEETVRSIILRMNRVQGGLLGPRLSVMTGERGLFSRHDWMRWFRRANRTITLAETRMAPLNPHASPPGERSAIAELDTETFARLESYVQLWPDRRLDVVFAVDCSGSMRSIFSRTQSIMSDSIQFLNDLTDDPRFGLVAFRDIGEEFETRPSDLTRDHDVIRRQTWLQEAVDGGRSSEAVLRALHDCYAMPWREGAERLVILIGDGPPHPGEGRQCVRLAERALRDAGIRTQVVEPINAPVRYFDQIAEAGGGRLWTLDDYIFILAEQLGMPRSERLDRSFADFIGVYTELLR